MKKTATILLFVLLVLGPASVSAKSHDAPCSDGHHGVMKQAMENCHNAPCCVMAATTRGSDPAPKQVKRTFSAVVVAPQLDSTIVVDLVDTGGCLGGCPSPAVFQTTPILRR
jgi:hypothetical protein